MKLYTKTICPKCLFVKSEINRLGLEAEIVNIDKDEEAYQKVVDAGIMSMPVVEIDGQLIADQAEILEKLEEMAE